MPSVSLIAEADVDATMHNVSGFSDADVVFAITFMSYESNKSHFSTTLR